MNDKATLEGTEENGEKGFNDAELEDIMNEIESLEKEFVEEPVAASAPAPTPTPVAPSVEDNSSSTSAPVGPESLKLTEAPHRTDDAFDKAKAVAMSVSESAQPQNVVDIQPINKAPVAPATPTAWTSSPSDLPAQIEMGLVGQMNMTLHFRVGGEHISLKVEEGGLLIEMQNGAKFTVPLQNKKKAS